MKRLSRDFTLKEKILLLVLAIVLIIIAYYYFIDQPVRTTIATCKSEGEALDVQINGAVTKIQSLEAMKQELEKYQNNPDIAKMPSYNDLSEEITFLNGVLATADSYNISFADVTRDQNQIRRDVSLQFTASDYNTALKMIRQLSESKVRCLLGDVSYSSESNNVMTGKVSANLVITFYETMAGGTEDAGLPAEEDQAAESTDDTSADSSSLGY